MRNPFAVFFTFFLPACILVDITGSTEGPIGTSTPPFEPLAGFSIGMFRTLADMCFAGAMTAVPDTLCSIVLLGGAISVECFKILGRGSYGTVYRALAKAPGKFGTMDVAVKVSNRVIKNKLDKTFDREVEVLKSLKHPNIVKLVADASDASFNYLLLELLSGGSLDSLISGNIEVPVGCALFLIRQLVEAVAALHEAGYAHKDIKPANIMLRSVRPGAGLVLCNFGIARHVATEGHSYGGTHGWMAPEVYDGNGGFAADWFSVALVLFALLSGQTLNSLCGDEWTVAQVTRSGKIAEMLFNLGCWKNRGIPKQVERFIFSLWVKDPNDRPSAKDIKEMIWGLCKSFPYQSKGTDPAGVSNEDEDIVGFLDAIMQRKPQSSLGGSFATADLPPTTYATALAPTTFATARGSVQASSASTIDRALRSASASSASAFITARSSSASSVSTAAATAGSAVTDIVPVGDNANPVAPASSNSITAATAGSAVTDVVAVRVTVPVRVGRLKRWRRKVKDKIKRKLGTG